MTPTELTAKIIEYCNKIISRAPDIFYGDDSINEPICPFCEIPICIETRICGKCGVGIPDFDLPPSSDESVEENDKDNSDIMAIDRLLWMGEELPPDTKSTIVAESEKLSLYNSSDYIGAFRLRGNAYYNAGELDSALRDFDEIIKFKLFAIKKLLSYYEEKKGVSNVEDLKGSVLPNFAFDYVRRGVVYSKLKQFHKTVENFEEAILLNCDLTLRIRWPSDGLPPHQARGYRGYGIRYNVGQFRRVISDLTRTIEGEPNNGLAHACRGFCLYYNCSSESRETEVNNALDDLEKAVRLEPDLVFAYNIRANIFRDEGQYDEALGEFNKTIVMAPKHANSYIGRGYTYSKLREYEKAIDDLKVVLQMRPDNLFVDFRFSQLYSWKKKDYEERVEKYSKSINEYPDRAVSYIYRGCAYYQLGHFNSSFYEQALADLNTALCLNPKSSMAYTYRGSVFIETQQIDKAIEDFNTAISLSPNYGLAYNMRGIVYLKKGDYLKAKDDFDRSEPLNRYDWYCRAKVRRELEKQK